MDLPPIRSSKREKNSHVRSLHTLADLFLRQREIDLSAPLARTIIESRDPHLREPRAFFKNLGSTFEGQSRKEMVGDLLLALENARELEARGKISLEELLQMVRAIEAFMTAPEKLWMLYEAVTMHMLKGSYRNAMDLLSGPSPLASIPGLVKKFDQDRSEGAIAMNYRRTHLNALTAYCSFASAFSDFARSQEQRLRQEVSALSASSSQDLLIKRRAPSGPPSSSSAPSIFPAVFFSRFLWQGFSQDESKAMLHSDALKALRTAATHVKGSADLAYGAVQLNIAAGAVLPAVAIAEEAALLHPNDADCAALRCAAYVVSGADPLAAAAVAGAPALLAALGSRFGGGTASLRQTQGGLLGAAAAGADPAQTVKVVSALAAAVSCDPGGRTAAEASLRIARLMQREPVFKAVTEDAKCARTVLESLLLALESLPAPALHSSPYVALPIWTTLARCLDHFYASFGAIVADFERDETLLDLEWEQARLDKALRPLLALQRMYRRARATFWPRVVFREMRAEMAAILKDAQGLELLSNKAFVSLALTGAQTRYATAVLEALQGDPTGTAPQTERLQGLTTIVGKVTIGAALLKRSRERAAAEGGAAAAQRPRAGPPAEWWNAFPAALRKR